MRKRAQNARLAMPSRTYLRARSARTRCFASESRQIAPLVARAARYYYSHSSPTPLLHSHPPCSHICMAFVHSCMPQHRQRPRHALVRLSVAPGHYRPLPPPTLPPKKNLDVVRRRAAPVRSGGAHPSLPAAGRNGSSGRGRLVRARSSTRSDSNQPDACREFPGEPLVYETRATHSLARSSLPRSRSPLTGTRPRRRRRSTPPRRAASIPPPPTPRAAPPALPALPTTSPSPSRSITPSPTAP